MANRFILMSVRTDVDRQRFLLSNFAKLKDSCAMCHRRNKGRPLIFYQTEATKFDLLVLLVMRSSGLVSAQRLGW